jgi:hypothetical protein
VLPDRPRAGHLTEGDRDPRIGSGDLSTLFAQTSGQVFILTTIANVVAHQLDKSQVKRKPIFAKYSAEIEDLYARDLHPEIHEPASAATVQPA